MVVDKSSFLEASFIVVNQILHIKEDMTCHKK